MHPFLTPCSIVFVLRQTAANCIPPKWFYLFVLGWGAFMLCFVSTSTAALLVHPRITVGMEYTDNVFLDPTDEEGDFNTRVSPGINLSLSGRKGMLAVDYNPTYDSYVRFPEQTYWGHDLSVNGWGEVTRNTRIELANTFRRTTDPLSETDTTVRQNREPYDTNTTTVGVVNSFGTQNTIRLNYTYYNLENKDPSVEDSSYQRPGMLMTYWFLSNRYAIDIEANYTNSEFELSDDYEELETMIRFTKRISRRVDVYVQYDHLSTDFLNEEEDYRVYSPQIGFAWAEREGTQWGGSFGYFYRDNAVSEDDDGIVGSMEMTYGWSADGSIGINGSVGYDQAYFGSENLGFNPYYEVSGSVSQVLARQLTGTLTAGYRRNLYLDEDPDREDIIWRGGGGLAYQVLPWMTIHLDYRYAQVNSNINENDYTENSGILSVTLSPRQPINW